MRKETPPPVMVPAMPMGGMLSATSKGMGMANICMTLEAVSATPLSPRYISKERLAGRLAATLLMPGSSPSVPLPCEASMALVSSSWLGLMVLMTPLSEARMYPPSSPLCPVNIIMACWIAMAASELGSTSIFMDHWSALRPADSTAPAL